MKKEIMKEIMLGRRSIRKYTDEEVSKENIDLLLQYAMSGPSACNKKPWKFIVVTNKEVLSELKRVSLFSNMNAPCAIIVCGDENKALIKNMSSFWVQDCSAAIENILLGAESLDLGTCWIGIYPQERVVMRMKKILKIEDEKIIPLGMIYLGHKGETKEPRSQFDEKNVTYIE